MVDLASLYRRYTAEVAIDPKIRLYAPDFDTLIWDICIMGGVSSYITDPHPDVHERLVTEYMGMYERVLQKSLGSKLMAESIIPLEVLHTTIVVTALIDFRSTDRANYETYLPARYHFE